MSFSNRLQMRIEGHLSAPITPDECKFLLENEEFFCRRHRICKKKIKEEKAEKFSYDLCHSVWTCLEKLIGETQRPIDKLFQIALQNLKIQKETIKHTCIFEQEEIPEILKKSYYKKFFVEGIKDKLQSQLLNPGQFIDLDPLPLLVEKEITIFKCPNHGSGILPTNTLIGCLDNVQALGPLLMYWWLCDLNFKYQKQILPVGLKQIEYLKILREKHGERFFHIVKNLEPLVKGHIIKQSNDLEFSQLYDVALQEIKTIEFGFLTSYFVPSDQRKITQMLYLELLGIVKMFGHPLLDPEKGWLKVLEKTVPYKPIDR